MGVIKYELKIDTTNLNKSIRRVKRKIFWLKIKLWIIGRTVKLSDKKYSINDLKNKYYFHR